MSCPPTPCTARPDRPSVVMAPPGPNARHLRAFDEPGPNPIWRLPGVVLATHPGGSLPGAPDTDGATDRRPLPTASLTSLAGLPKSTAQPPRISAAVYSRSSGLTCRIRLNRRAATRNPVKNHVLVVRALRSLGFGEVCESEADDYANAGRRFSGRLFTVTLVGLVSSLIVTTETSPPPN